VRFTIFLDDSGTSPSQHVAIASAVVIPTSRLLLLEREWNALKSKEGFSCFHMSEFAALNPKSEFAGWVDKQDRVAKRIRQIVKKYAVKAFSMSVNKEDYEQVVPNELRKYVGKFHYTWAISNVLALIEKWASDNNMPILFEYVFDCMGKRRDPRRQEVEDVLELCEDIATQQGNPGQFAHCSFKSRCELPALQCADIIAWTCYQHALLAFRNTPMKPIATDMWRDLRSHQNKGWLWAVTIKRDHLEDWAKKELEDGRAIKRFQAWETNRAARESRGAHRT
jgi:hypothetical protein